MNCPFCGNEMTPGFLQSCRQLMWDKVKRSGAVSPGEDGMKLTKWYADPSWITAYFCKGCNMLISPLNEK